MALLYAAIGCYIGFIVFADAGFGLALLAAHVVWRRRDWSQPLFFMPLGELVHYWQVSQAIAFKFRGLPWQWVCIDEVPPEEFAALRRYAKQSLLRQPVGLSISK